VTEDELFRAYGLPLDWGRPKPDANDVLAQLLQLLLVLAMIAEVAQGGDDDRTLRTDDVMTDTIDARWMH